MATQSIEGRADGKRVTWVVALIALSVLLNYVDRGAIGVAAPLMKEELGLSATGFGLAVSAFFWVYAPACLFVGWLCDRFCVYRVFALGVAVWAISTALTGFAGGLISLIVLRLFLGLGESIAFPGSSKIFAAEVPVERRGIANASVSAAIAFGPAIGVLTGGAILGMGVAAGLLDFRRGDAAMAYSLAIRRGTDAGTCANSAGERTCLDPPPAPRAGAMEDERRPFPVELRLLFPARVAAALSRQYAGLFDRRNDGADDAEFHGAGDRRTRRRLVVRPDGREGRQ